ncbi:MAG: hypothetical protein ABWX84_09585 [Nocardioides sp.]
MDDVRGKPGEAVLTFRCGRDPRTYGIPIPLGDPSKEFYFPDNPVSSIDEWLESVRVGMSIHIGTGLNTRGRRTLVDDYIELRETNGWEYDPRFYLDVVEPDEPQSWDRVELLAQAGLDAAPAIASRDEGRLIGWVTAYEDASEGNPYAGHAVVSWTGDETADLEHVEVGSGTPVTLVVGLARRGAHLAGGAGALSVTTSLDTPELDLVGFRYASDGRRVVDTTFLDEDPSGAAALLRDVLTLAGQVETPRDTGGRHQESSGRWWARARRGPAEAPAPGDGG